MKEWKVLLSINLSLLLLLGSVCPAAYAVELPSETAAEETIPTENAGDLLSSVDTDREELPADEEPTDGTEELQPDDILGTWNVGQRNETDATATLYGDGRLVIEGTGAIEKGDWPTTITSVKIGNGITNVPYRAFYNCSALETVEIGSGLRLIEEDAFWKCRTLTTITIDAYEMTVTIEDESLDDVTIIYKIPDAGEVIATWYIGQDDETDATATLYGDGRLVIEGTGEIKSADWPKTIIAVEIRDGITNVPDSAFRNLRNLQRVTFGEDIETIESSAFYGCTNLKNIQFGKNLDYIGFRAFENAGLESVAIPDSVTDIGSRAFYGCESLQQVSIGTGVKWLSDSVFYNCKSLTEIYWNAKSCNDLDSDSEVFFGAGNAGAGITLTIGSSVTRIPAYLFYTSSNTVGGDVLLREIQCRSYRLQSIGEFAFYRCSALETVELSSNLYEIGDGAFNSCTALKTITLPDTLTTIGRKAFFRTGLTAVALGQEVTAIGESAFAECADGFLIKGYIDSYAQQYAQQNGIPFLAYQQSGTIGKLTWGFDPETDTLSISGSGKIPDYTGTPPWEAFCGRIESVALSDGIAAIGANAFAGCTSLWELKLPAGVTTLSNQAFSGCSDLTTVYFYGQPPVLLDADGQETQSPFPEKRSMAVRYLRTASGWDGIAWENCTIQSFSDQKVTVNLDGNRNFAYS